MVQELLSKLMKCTITRRTRTLTIVMELHILRLPLIVDGPTEKASQFIIPLMLYYNKEKCLNVQNCIFEECRNTKTIKISL